MPDNAALQKLILTEQFLESLTAKILPFIRRALLTIKT
jgi:hypothetical protein